VLPYAVIFRRKNVNKSVFFREICLLEKNMVQQADGANICNCCLICFNKHKICRYVCADGNVVTLEFINVIDLCRLIVLCLF
jgi:hypothetical protein